MDKADNTGPRGRGFVYRAHEKLKKFLVYSIDILINAPMTCLTLNRLQKGMMVGRKTKNYSNWNLWKISQKCSADLSLTNGNNRAEDSYS